MHRCQVLDPVYSSLWLMTLIATIMSVSACGQLDKKTNPYPKAMQFLRKTLGGLIETELYLTTILRRTADGRPQQSNDFLNEHPTDVRG